MSRARDSRPRGSFSGQQSTAPRSPTGLRTTALAAAVLSSSLLAATAQADWRWDRPSGQNAEDDERNPVLLADSPRFDEPGPARPVRRGPRRPDERRTGAVDFRAPIVPRIDITPNLSFGAEIELTAEFEKDFDLDSGVDDDLTALRPEASLAVSFHPDRHFEAFVEASLGRDFVVDSPKGAFTRPTELLVKEAYWIFRDIGDTFSLQLGRQLFDDERKWLYDEELDGVRLFLPIAGLEFELSASREALVSKDVLNADDIPSVNNYFFVAQYPLGEESEVSAYALFRDDKSDIKEDIYLFGLRSFGEIMPDFDYWLEASHVRGDNDGTDISGFGIDLGGTYVFDHPLEPSVSLGWAFGTGDDKTDGGTDENFRQTGLQDNSSDFNSVTEFKYYGEVFDPELSNLMIATAGLGLKPIEEASIDIVYHFYRQDRAADTIRDSAITADPDGVSNTLGHEVDVILGVEIGDFAGELIFGVFVPGAAFPSNADNAYFGAIELQYEF